MGSLRRIVSKCYDKPRKCPQESRIQGIILLMRPGFAFLPLLPLCFLICWQTPDQNSTHVKEWTDRHAHYLGEPKIKRIGSWLHVTANDPRPLDNVLGALEHQHGWHINYEDPQYRKADIVDDTAPSWLQEHPNGPRAYVVAGGAFYAQIAVDQHFPEDPTQVLTALVEAYNRSGNPGRFELRSANHESFDIVPTAAADGPQTPLLDTVMDFATTDSVSASSLEAFCEELTRQSGQSIELFFVNPTSQGIGKINLHVQKQPAREILRQMLGQITSTKSWRLLYDPDVKKFLLTFR